MTHPHRRKDDPQGMWDEFVAMLRDLMAAIGLAAFCAVAGFAAGYYWHKVSGQPVQEIKATTPDCGSCKRSLK